MPDPQPARPPWQPDPEDCLRLYREAAGDAFGTMPSATPGLPPPVAPPDLSPALRPGPNGGGYSTTKAHTGLAYGEDPQHLRRLDVSSPACSAPFAALLAGQYRDQAAVALRAAWADLKRLRLHGAWWELRRALDCRRRARTWSRVTP